MTGKRRNVVSFDELVDACRSWSASAGLAPVIEAAALCYLQELQRGMEQSNLLGFRTAEDIVREALADGFALAGSLEPPQQLVDIGSGAGLPGVGMALSWAEVPTFLVEPRTLRANFLEGVARSLGRPSLVAVKAKVPAWRPPRGVQTLYVARAVGPADRLRELLDGIVGHGDRLFVAGASGGGRGWRQHSYTVGGVQRSGGIWRY